MRDLTSKTLLLALAALLAVLVSCGTGRPDSGEEEPKRRIVLATEYDDTRAGQEAAENVAGELGFIEDEALDAYLQTIGRRLVAHAPSRPFDYQFRVIDQQEPNAFALPGGFIYVSRGALALANSEDELANVVGHEITHAAERHAAARQGIALRQSPLLMPLLRFARLAAYSRDQEHSADRGGQEMAAAAGYDPMGMASFLDQLRDVERLRFRANDMPNFLSTHPGTTERVTECTLRARSLSFARTPETDAAHENYLRAIDGLLVGDNPAEGVFEQSTFLHPDLGFRIRFPAEWVLENGRDAVGARSQNGDAHIFLTLEAPAEDGSVDPRRAAETFLSRSEGQYSADLSRARRIQIGSLDAFRLEGRGVIDGRNLGAQMTFIVFDGRVYRLTAVAPIRVSKDYAGRARVTARSFRPMTPAERLSVAETRIAVTEARAGETLGDLSGRTGNAWDDRRIAVINSLPSDHVFEGGEFVKIAVAKTYRVNP